MEKHWKCKLSIDLRAVHATMYESVTVNMLDAIVTLLETEKKTYKIVDTMGNVYNISGQALKDLEALLPVLVPLSQDMETMEEVVANLKKGNKYEWYFIGSMCWNDTITYSDDMVRLRGSKLENQDVQRIRKAKTTYKYYRPCKTVEEAEHLLGKIVEYDSDGKRAITIITDACLDHRGKLRIDMEDPEALLKSTKDYTPIGVEIKESEMVNGCIKVETKNGSNNKTKLMA